MAKLKKPAEYKCPLKKRADIINWIFAVTNQRHYHHQHPFCFNVKCPQLDFSFEHLLGLFRQEEGAPYTHDDGWLKRAHERFDEIDENTLWEWAQEDACGDFVGRGSTGIPDSDMFNHLWDGTSIDVQYSFEGRSGGWLSINRFEGDDFTASGADAQEMLVGMDYRTLRKFYQLVVMLKHDLRSAAIKSTMEHGASWAFFGNVCEEIPKPDAIQKKLPFMKAV